MSIINEKDLENAEKMGGPEVRYNKQGLPIAWKYPYLPHWYDSASEALKENQFAARIQTLKAKGLNEHGQTKEQEEAFKKKKIAQQKLKDKAQLSVEMTAQAK